MWGHLQFFVFAFEVFFHFFVCRLSSCQSQPWVEVELGFDNKNIYIIIVPSVNRMPSLNVKSPLHTSIIIRVTTTLGHTCRLGLGYPCNNIGSKQKSLHNYTLLIIYTISITSCFVYIHDPASKEWLDNKFIFSFFSNAKSNNPKNVVLHIVITLRHF